MINAAIIGASGYTGSDAIGMLLNHNQAQLTYLTALEEECGKVEEVFPRFKGRCDLEIEPLDFDKLSNKADVVLCCLPHKVSMGFVPKLLEAGLKVIDFSADYRIKNAEVYEKYYQQHTDKGNLAKAVYGLPEIYREEIKKISQEEFSFIEESKLEFKVLMSPSEERELESLNEVILNFSSPEEAESYARTILDRCLVKKVFLVDSK